MDIKSALKRQYLAGLAMLKECVERCPADVWTSGTHPRKFWRIAYHVLFYTHLYLQPNEEAFQPWIKHRQHAPSLWSDIDSVDAYSPDDILSYIGFIETNVSDWVDHLDLDAPETGFDWYPNMTKLDHQMMNLRHLQGHIGQLSEILMANDSELEIEWTA